VILKHLYLYLNEDDFPDDVQVPFGFKTRYLCNYLERELRRLRYMTEGFSKICVRGCIDAISNCPIVPENAAMASVVFDRREYESLAPEEHHEFFIRMLVGGLEKCARFHRIPLAEMCACLDEFRRGGYRNDWVHETKTLRQVGLRASLLCRLDVDAFVLTLRLERNGTTVLEDAILKTKPDELVFSHRFKDVVLKGSAVVVRDKFGRPTFSVDAVSLH
jgi:hypothetical protein